MVPDDAFESRTSTRTVLPSVIVGSWPPVHQAGYGTPAGGRPCATIYERKGTHMSLPSVSGPPCATACSQAVRSCRVAPRTACEQAVAHGRWGTASLCPSHPTRWFRHLGMLGWLVVLAALDARPLLGAAGQLELAVVDRQSRKPIPCRLHLYNASGKPRTVPGVPFWQDHVAMPGKLVLKLPVGEYTFEIERGPEYVSRGGHFRIDNFADDTKEVDLGRFVDMSALGWWSGDNDVRRPVRDIELLMLADDLHLAQVITWSSDRSEGSRQSPPKDPVVRFDGNRYYH